MSDLPADPDDEMRAGVEHQGNIMFWLTMACGAAILVACAVVAVVL
jgi:hypothetical protein